MMDGYIHVINVPKDTVIVDSGVDVDVGESQRPVSINTSYKTEHRYDILSGRFFPPIMSTIYVISNQLPELWY